MLGLAWPVPWWRGILTTVVAWRRGRFGWVLARWWGRGVARGLRMARRGRFTARGARVTRWVLVPTWWLGWRPAP